MKLKVDVTDEMIRELILEHLREKLGPAAKLTIEDVVIKVRSKQNYRNHEWETGELSVAYDGDI